MFLGRWWCWPMAGCLPVNHNLTHCIQEILELGSGWLRKWKATDHEGTPHSLNESFLLGWRWKSLRSSVSYRARGKRGTRKTSKCSLCLRPSERSTPWRREEAKISRLLFRKEGRRVRSGTVLGSTGHPHCVPSRWISSHSFMQCEWDLQPKFLLKLYIL